MESFGIPHTEIDLILVNGNSAPFSQAIHPGDRLSVYPVFEAFEISLVDLPRQVRSFTHYMACKGLLQDVPKAHVQSLIPPRAAELHEEFRQGLDCGRVYWKGSHYRRMEKWIRELVAGPPTTEGD
jgi:hypothetical protein